jgi:hypothetical protein
MLSLHKKMHSLLGVGVLAGLVIGSGSAAYAATYQLDDGTAVGAVSIGAGTNGVLVNSFTTQSGFETIFGIEMVFSPAGNVQDDFANEAFNLVVYSDPNNDGDFHDAVLLYSQEVFVPTTVTTAPATYSFVSGITFDAGDVFYVGYEEPANSKIQVATDGSGGFNSWAAWAGTNPVEAGMVGRFSSFGSGFTRDMMLRAVTTAPIPEPGSSAALLGGVVMAGMLVRRRRRS